MIRLIIRKKPADISRFWLRTKDLNPNKMSQSHSCYHYTSPQYKYLYNRNEVYYNINFRSVQA